MRLDKFLAHQGFGTRKNVKEIIKDEVVSVNDIIITQPKTQIDPHTDHIKVDGETITYQKHVYYMLNKEAGSISSTESDLYPSVLEYIDVYRNDLMIVGRLDVDTEGLLLITSDGQFLHKIAHGKNNVPKTYHVELEKPFNQAFIPLIEKGIILDDGKLKGAHVDIIDDSTLHLTIYEGKYHQVKRMMHACENEVVYLKRIKINDLTLDDDLMLGSYRELTETEVTNLLKAKG